MVTVAGLIHRSRRAAKAFLKPECFEASTPPPVSQPPQAREFNHSEAQAYELSHAEITIRDTFAGIYQSVQEERARGGTWQSAGDMWFQEDEHLWGEAKARMKSGACLEIGSGPYGYLAPCYWIARRIVVDPLVNEYRRIQIETIGKTFFDENIITFNRNAEERIDELVGKIDGCIICQNALDHGEDPLAVMLRISEYAARGCLLMLSTDIWHWRGLDAGHRNITKEEEAMGLLVRGAGFRILKLGRKFRDPAEYAQYVVLAQKA